MEKKKLLLVSPPTGYFKSMKVLPESLCLLAASVLKNLKNFEVKILDAQTRDYTLEQTTNKILEYSPDYLGFGVTILSIDSAGKIARKVKKSTNTKVIVGGPQVTLLPEESMGAYSAFDFGVIGEGEETLVNLLNSLEKKQSIKSVKGIIYRENKRIVKTPPARLIENLDELPMPAWHLLGDLALYSKSISRSWRFPAFSFLSSRGCPGLCIFCPKLYGRRIRAYSVERLIKVVDHLQKKYNIKHLDFYDDNFVVFRDRLKKFCSHIIKNKTDLTWTCLSRVNYMDKETVQLMKRAGCKKIEFGIESGNQEILDFEKKGITLEQVRNAVTLAHNSGIETAGFFIIGHPLETKKTIRETINFAKSLPLDDCFFSYMVPYPGTELYNLAAKYGQFEEDWSKMNQGEISFIPKGLTANDLRHFYKQGLKEFYFRPRIILHYLKKSIRQKKVLELVKQAVYFLKSMLKSSLK